MLRFITDAIFFYLFSDQIYACVCVANQRLWRDEKKTVCVHFKQKNDCETNKFIFEKKNLILHGPQYLVPIFAAILKCGAKQMGQMKRTKNNNIKECVFVPFFIFCLWTTISLLCSAHLRSVIVAHNNSCQHFPLRFFEQNFIKKFNQRTRPTITKSNQIYKI